MNDHTLVLDKSQQTPSNGLKPKGGTQMTKLSDLLAQRAELDQQIEAERKNALIDIRNKINALLAENEMTLEEVFPSGSMPKAATKGKKSPKYKSPDGQKTWTGHGRAPGWIYDHEAAGGARDELLINP